MLPTNGLRILVATKPVDFRKGHDGLAALVSNDKNPMGRLWQYLDPKGGSDVLVYYSGHGVPGQNDQRSYMLPANADPAYAEINGYPLDVLYKNLGKLKARSKTVLIDACFSGASPKGMLIDAASPVFITAKASEIGEGMTVLTAASGDQLASWDKKAQHGLFTNYFLDAVYGKGDVNGDGRVTAAEIKGYLDDKMTRAARRTYRRVQEATLLGEGSSVLASYTPGRPFKRTKVVGLEPVTRVPEPKQVASLPPPKAEIKIAILDEEMLATNKSTVRSQPTTRSDVLGSLDRGESIYVTGWTNIDRTIWYRVELASGEDGYVLGSLLKEPNKNKQRTTPAQVRKNLSLARKRLAMSANLLKDGLTPEFEHLQLKTEVEELEREFLKLSNTNPVTPVPDQMASIPLPKSAFKVIDLVERMLAVKNAKVWSEPSTRSDILDHLNFGESVNVTGKTKVNGSIWYRMALTGRNDGWVSGSELRQPLGAGLTIQDVNSKRGNKNEVAVLIVTGTVANVSDTLRDVPLIRVSLLNNDSEEVQFINLEPDKAQINPGANITFKGLITAPEATARRLEVTFTELPGPPIYHEFPQLVVELKKTDNRASYIKVKVVAEIVTRDLPFLQHREKIIVDEIQRYLHTLTRDDASGGVGTERMRKGIENAIALVMGRVKLEGVLFREILFVLVPT